MVVWNTLQVILPLECCPLVSFKIVIFSFLGRVNIFPQCLLNFTA